MREEVVTKNRIFSSGPGNSTFVINQGDKNMNNNSNSSYFWLRAIFTVGAIAAGVYMSSSTAIAAPRRQNVCLDDNTGDFGVRRHCKTNETDIDVDTLRALVVDVGASVKAEKGDKGEKGDPGVQGPIGPRGEPGPQGIKGDVGAQGDRGPQGERGVAGDVGPQGERGLQGLSGEAGVAGYEVIGQQLAVAPGSAATLLVRCPEGKLVLGGGGIGIGGNLDNFRVVHSVPVIDNLGAAWQARFLNEGTNVRNFSVYAICAKVSF